MKGLIIKDFINLKKQAGIITVMMVLYLIISITSKNGAAFGAMIFIMFALLPVSTMSYDERASWDKYALTMPVSRVDMVLSKYILSLILSSIALILNFIAQAAMGNEMNYENITVIFAVFGISMIYISLILPIMFKFGVEKGRMLMMVVLMLPMIVVLLFSNIVKTALSEEMIKKALYAFPAAAVLLFLASIFVSVKLYSKKEF